ncbi:class I SAM-dependent methyltransferase [Streptomyces sp. CMB-StM0423]|uniref:class I SAM-dependent methyltransferase n=1 Tax=Streptomyces sp. CMB-StM0423 TaxID=2059884 RepID=UPI000C701B4E|nr:class I SAM-dependent methyltransferase [Streptomyces sp. CMB-StM0423]AUH44481.1 SAM-dependent methyltransferase [Streptomyces sp. CMB-StM0423]
MPSPTRAAQDAVYHPYFARFYARLSVAADEHGGVAELRKELLTGLSGRVVEIGAGNGLNFAHYPPAVSEVVAIEPERHLRQLAAEAALRAAVRVDVLPGTAEELPVGSGSCDAAVASLVLCSVADVPRSLGELRRVLRPGGELRFYEHGQAGGRVMRAVQRAADRTVWPLLLGGCHSGRDVLGELTAAGFTLGPYRRVRMPEKGPPTPASYHVLGTALRG